MSGIGINYPKEASIPIVTPIDSPTTLSPENTVHAYALKKVFPEHEKSLQELISFSLPYPSARIRWQDLAKILANYNDGYFYTAFALRTFFRFKSSVFSIPQFSSEEEKWQLIQQKAASLNLSRYFFLPCPAQTNKRKISWTPEEDSQLQQIVLDSQSQDSWSTIKEKFTQINGNTQQRSGKQLRERYYEHLIPGSKTFIALSDKEILFELCILYHCLFNGTMPYSSLRDSIAKEKGSHYTDLAIKNFFYLHVKNFLNTDEARKIKNCVQKTERITYLIKQLTFGIQEEHQISSASSSSLRQSASNANEATISQFPLKDPIPTDITVSSQYTHITTAGWEAYEWKLEEEYL